MFQFWLDRKLVRQRENWKPTIAKHIKVYLGTPWHPAPKVGAKVKNFAIAPNREGNSHGVEYVLIWILSMEKMERSIKGQTPLPLMGKNILLAKNDRHTMIQILLI